MPAIPSSGPISLSDFAAEFGGTVPHSLSEYYRDGGNVPSNNTNVPTSGVFRFGNMRGAINAIIQTLSNTTNVDLSTLFGSDWSSTVPKEIIIPSGVTIGGTGSSNALLVPSGMGGTLTITNAGSIIGYGGAAGSAGGNAISIASTGVTVDNTGLIAGGGGGGGVGGSGGTGGQGRYTGNSEYTGITSNTNPPGSEANCTSNCNNLGKTYHYHATYGCGEDTCCCRCYCYNWVYTSGGSGGAGGSGGVGQGYNQSATSGSAGSGGAAGGTNAGSGGTGGTGGSGASYGASGSSGNSGSSGANGNYTNGSGGSGGASGGAAGAAVIYTAAYTMNNTGTLAGAA